ncbi:urocortin [Apteryx mantelli]|uniref:Urocortin n=1 Tax=Apteryx mantelli TaxID=2696672 RepID=A0ABM4EDF4_9AVES
MHIALAMLPESPSPSPARPGPATKYCLPGWPPPLDMSWALVPGTTSPAKVRTEPRMRRALLTLLLLLARPPPAPARPDGAVPGAAAGAGAEARGRPAWPPLPPPREPWRARRDEPPLSIDLTFHLLRHLLLLARAQSQRARADDNRLILDAVGR